MRMLTGRTAKLCTLALGAMVLVGCESKITQENFAKINNGMTLTEVQKILGGAGEEDSSPTGMTISGAGIGGSSRESNEKTYVWKTDGATIIVVIADGKVVDKRQTGL